MALDTTFGTNGQGWTISNVSHEYKNFIVGQVIDSLNRTVVVIDTADDIPQGSKLIISRYTSDGLVDTKFGKDGYVIDDYYNNSKTIGTGITLDKDGNILVTGTTVDSDGKYFLFVSKYSSEGVLDRGFGGTGTGFVTYAYPDYNNISGSNIALDNSGNILVTGGVLNEELGSILFLVVRYFANGTLDKTFGDNGLAIITDSTINTFAGIDLAIDKSGSIIVSGINVLADGILVKINSTGTLDKNFGSGAGYINLDKNILIQSDFLHLQLDNQSRILITAGYKNITAGYSDIYLARYNSDGSIDRTFGDNNGYTTTAIPNFLYGVIGTSLALDSNNRIIVTSISIINSVNNYLSSILTRYTSNGILDTTFGDSGSGYSVFDKLQTSLISNISLDNNGRIVVSGSGGITEFNTLIIRYLNEGSTTTTTTHYEPICLVAGTPILTDQGLVAIEKIDTNKHTINNKRIVAITKTITPEEYLVCFEANSMGINCPTQRTIMTPGHEVLYKGKLVQAKHFLGRLEGVHTVQYNGKDVLYNVLQEQHGLMRVNNMVLETLHPENKVAKRILCHK